MADEGSYLARFMMMQKSLFSSLHLKDVLEAAVVQFADLSGGSKVAIFLADNESLALKLMASRGYSEASLESLRVVPFAAESILKYVVQKRVPMAIPPGKPAPDLSAAVMASERSVAQMALPLIHSNLLVGAVLLDLARADILQRQDFFKDVADIAAVAMANSILFGRSEYERERMNTLYKTSCALSGSVLRGPEVLQIACDTALVLGNTPNCAILLFDPAQQCFNLAAFKGLEGQSLADFDLGVEGTVAGRCLATGRSEYLADASAHAHRLPRAAGGSIFGSLVALPMIHEHQPVGVLMVLSTDARAFHREQIDLLESLVGQVTTALHVALTHESAAAQSIQDAHTGLYNRWHFEQALSREVERSARHNREVSLMLVDVDHLAHINEHLGQDKGDEAIRHVAGVIKGTLRDIDIPCRYGGEEFAVILPETPLANAADVAERLRTRIRAESAAGIGMVTVSVGLSAFPNNAHDADALLRSAEQALDVAKFEGRDRVKVCQSGLPASGSISWEELAQQARLSVISERQSKLKSRLESAPDYASWMRAAAARGAKKK